VSWLRCQFHAHTTSSDGEATPAELCEHYAAKGFDVLAITDHWHVTAHDPDDGLVLLPASELSCEAPVPSGEAEALALGVAALPEPREPFPDIEAMAAWIVERGGFPVLCHPTWSGLRSEHVLAAPSLAAIEVWNGASDVQQGNGLASVQWDELSQAGRLLPGVATDDCHQPGADSGFGWTWVDAADRTADAVLEALHAGRFHGSAGPRIEAVEVEAEGVTVRCSPVRSIRLCSGPWAGCAANAAPDAGDYRAEPLERDASGLLTAARLQRPELWDWARVELEDAAGRRAWAAPFAF
jgi:hypothetical protein